MWVKICGISSVEAAESCLAAGVDAIGFVFAESKRAVAVQKAAQIMAKLPPEIMKIGVFADTPLKEVSAIDQFLGLDLIQLHGSENPAYCRNFNQKVIKAFAMSLTFDLDQIIAYRGLIHASLIDTDKAGLRGGTGQPWNWHALDLQAVKRLSEKPVVIAGGLDQHNVIEALEILKPDGLDISSGVEENGQKSPQLIKQFMETVRRWQYEQDA